MGEMDIIFISKVAKNLHLHVESFVSGFIAYILYILYKFNGSWFFNSAIKPEGGKDLSRWRLISV